MNVLCEVIMIDRINDSESVEFVGSLIKNSQYSHFEQHKKNQRIDVKNNNNIYYIETGRISFYRVQDNMLTITMSAPCLAGVAQMLFQYQTHYIRCDESCSMWVISNQDIKQLISQNNLWMHMYNLLAKQVQLYFEREYMISQKSTREIVLQNLAYIWDMPEEERVSTSIYNFILLRTHISRSGIHKVISELEKEMVVETVRGKLTHLKR
jgi:hypothetical protein